MSDELPTATRIAALEDHVLRLLAENVRFVNEATDLRERLDSTRHSIITACTGSGCLNAHELRQALDRERERCGVLEREVRAARDWINVHMSHYSHGQRSKNDHEAAEWLEEAAKETDTRHALDAAKFVGGGQ